MDFALNIISPNRKRHSKNELFIHENENSTICNTNKNIIQISIHTVYKVTITSSINCAKNTVP